MSETIEIIKKNGKLYERKIIETEITREPICNLIKRYEEQIEHFQEKKQEAEKSLVDFDKLKTKK